ncbi:liver carboxylesterase 4-like isoform X2 [Trichoplusia ni]|uniref:Liver carboxylesterase 4-like isoform X2 n=1 Tax=Trichoplusia ni TaxID=7111 RepID=A0A7E5X2B4_TRINI|nr:liver carboxylesterase 4-like isoform X2 [Trichoplusia ni]
MFLMKHCTLYHPTSSQFERRSRYDDANATYTVSSQEDHLHEELHEIYAEPPLGPQRFQRPVRRYLAGEMMATNQCPPCPQPDPYQPRRIIGHEDCLCLNVYAPKMPATEQGSPVVFFIHGGNYRTGSTGPYGGQHLAQKDTILVTAQYRLGSLGYLSTGQRDAGGNLGLFDLHTAMVWIQDYIQFFGGDPKRVVVMGQGSGGSAASLMAMSPEGRSASGVAALSGTPLSPGAVRPDPAKHAEALAERTGCPKAPAESLLICLRKLPVEELVQADEDLNMDMVDTQRFLEEISGRSGAGARVEGKDDLRGLPPLVAEAPAESLNKEQKRVPFLTGVTKAETSRAVFGKFNKFLTNQLQTVTDFLKKDVIGGLQNVVSGVEGLIPLASTVTAALPVADYYQGLFDQAGNIVDGLAEIAEATGDALFNFPAYQSVEKWSSGGEAYLYSFEHIGNLSKGWNFLPGVALAERADDETTPKPKKAQGPAHGDELAYIFELLGPDGQPMSGDISSTDARVRDNFVGLISKFAHGLDEGARKKNTTSLFGALPFSKDTNQFLKISEKLTVDKDFRFCQIGLWGNMGDRLTGALCKNLLGNLLNLSKLPGQLPNQLTQQIPNQLTQQLPTQGSVPLVPGLFGKPATKAPARKPQRTTQGAFKLPFDF